MSSLSLQAGNCNPTLGSYFPPTWMVLLDVTVQSIMLGSALSGLLARIPCHGLDTLKARVQASGGGGVASVLRDLLHREGWRGLYRGFGIAAVGGVPASCLYFTTYEVCKAQWAGQGGLLPPPVAHLCAGLAAEAVSCTLYVPVDVVKERMQVQRPPAVGSSSSSSSSGVYYRSSRDALAQIALGTEGLRGLYKGYWATLASYGPFSALYFATYEWLKEAAQQWSSSRGSSSGGTSGEGGQAAAPLPLWLQVAAAGGAGACASLLTNPLDLVKLRLQVQRAAGQQQLQQQQVYRGLLHGLQCVVREEGLRGLLRGAGVRVAFHSASTAVAMSMFEQCREAARLLLAGQLVT